MSNCFVDLLGRRLSFPATHSSALRISPDGRVALSTGNFVSIVYSRAALQAPTLDPVSFQELFDETQRKARGVRTPAVSHVLVDDHPARALAWSVPPVLLSVPSSCNSSLRRLEPPFSGSSGATNLLEGSWGLSGTLWKVVSGFPQAPSDFAESTEMVNHVKDEQQVLSVQDCNSVEQPRSIVTSMVSAARVPNDVLCLSVFSVNAANEKSIALLKSDNSVRRATFVAFGFRNGVIVQRWHGKDSRMGEARLVWNEWTSSLEAEESIDMINAPGVMLAVGGSSGHVRIFSVMWMPNEHDDDFIKVDSVWNGADSVLRGPVVSFAFKSCSYTPNSVFLAIAVGNSVAGVRIDEIDEAGRKVFKARVSLAYDAHYQSVSSVCFLPDGSVLSSSKDGSISRWKFEWEDNTEPCTPLGVVQQQSPDLDSVVAMRPTPSCLLLVTLTTRPGVKGEIGEPAPVVKKKYHYLGRPTLLSILAYPIDVNDGEGLREALQNSITNKTERGKYADIPLTLWDVELWLLAHKYHMNLAETVLIENFERIRSLVNNEKYTIVRIRLRKVAHCVANVLERCVTDFGNKLGHIRKAQSALCVTILANYHFATLQRFQQFINRDVAVKLPQIERESLEAKYAFVMKHIKSLEGVSNAVIASVREIGDKLSECFPHSTRAFSMCDICEDLPLVADSEEPTSFWCVNGDVFSRCVLSALPTTDCVPRRCSGCGKCARIDTVKYAWSPDLLQCPICNCELLQGRAENNLSYKSN